MPPLLVTGYVSLVPSRLAATLPSRPKRYLSHRPWWYSQSSIWVRPWFMEHVSYDLRAMGMLHVLLGCRVHVPSRTQQVQYVHLEPPSRYLAGKSCAQAGKGGAFLHVARPAGSSPLKSYHPSRGSRSVSKKLPQLWELLVQSASRCQSFIASY